MIALLLALSLSLPVEHVVAARAAALVHHVDADLLLAIAHIESRHTQQVTRAARGGIACGPMQVRSRNAEHCTRLRTDLAFGYSEGARVFAYWLAVARGDVASAARGYGCGWQTDKRGRVIKPARIARKCNAFETRVIARWNRMRTEARS